MKWLDELLGFAVLTSPLWLILILLPVALWIAIKIARRFKQTSVKVAVGLFVFALLVLIPFADEIAGRIYLNHLCATQAGIKVYQTVELPAEYWDEGGRARFIREGSLQFDQSMLGNRYARKSAIHPQSALLRLNRDSYQLIDTQTQLLIGENINFVYWGGWIARNLSPHVSAVGCSRQQVGYFSDVLKQVFKPTGSR